MPHYPQQRTGHYQTVKRSNGLVRYGFFPRQGITCMEVANLLPTILKKRVMDETQWENLTPDQRKHLGRL